MNNMFTFEDLLKRCPSHIVEKLDGLKALKERKDYHPEGNTYEHIRIVTTRLISTGDINLILAGLFHDICKLDAAEKNHAALLISDPVMFETMKADGVLKTYGHEHLASRYVSDNTEFIRKMGANVKKVAMIVENHMRIKQMTNMRESKVKAMIELPVFKELLIFKEADNMLKPFLYEKK